MEQSCSVNQETRLLRWLCRMAIATQFKLNIIMATQAEIVQKLNNANTALTDIAAEVDKVGTETDALNDKVTALQAIIDGMGNNASPELEAAMTAVTDGIAALKAKVVAVDDKVTDAAPPA